MGVYDEIYLTCPKCGQIQTREKCSQTKATAAPYLDSFRFDGDLKCLERRDYEDFQADVRLCLADVADWNFKCEHCSAHFMVKAKFTLEIVGENEAPDV